jgi:pimeloyl-ACP methyl ester carboxylesterase
VQFDSWQKNLGYNRKRHQFEFDFVKLKLMPFSVVHLDIMGNSEYKESDTIVSMLLRRKKGTEKICTTTIEGQHLYYRSFGNDNSKPLVLLHGFGVSGYMWQRCIPYLAQQAQVFVVDLPGHGHSRLRGAWRLRAMAPLLALWIEQMGIAPIRLVGHSMGGAIAIHLTASAPDLVERLVLVNAASIPLEATIPALCVRTVRSILQPGGGGYPWRLLGDVLKPRPRLFWQAAQDMLRSDFRAELGSIDLPTLILWGERDVLLPLALGQQLHEALPHATFISLPNCGHRPPLSQPELFSRLVLEWLSY